MSGVHVEGRWGGWEGCLGAWVFAHLVYVLLGVAVANALSQSALFNVCVGLYMCFCVCVCLCVNLETELCE